MNILAHIFSLNIGTCYLLDRDSCTSFLELRVTGSEAVPSSPLEENDQFLKEIIPPTPLGMGYKGTKRLVVFLSPEFLKILIVLFRLTLIPEAVHP